jgi:hypothetical protein
LLTIRIPFAKDLKLMSSPKSAVAPHSAAGLETSPSHDVVHARYLVVGLADPGLLPRLVEPFSKLGTTPSRVHASCEAGDRSELTVDLRLNNVPPRTAELVELALRRVVGVRQLIAVTEAA